MADVNRIKLVLVEKKRTSKWLAEQLGVNPSTVSKWCTNSSQPDLACILKIADPAGSGFEGTLCKGVQAMPSFPISEFQKKDNGSETNVEKLLCLTQEEKTMFEYLKENNYRLEQEKIPYEYISSRIPE